MKDHDCDFGLHCWAISAIELELWEEIKGKLKLKTFQQWDLLEHDKSHPRKTVDAFLAWESQNWAGQSTL